MQEELGELVRRLAAQMVAASDEERYERAALVARAVWQARYKEPAPEFDWREFLPPQEERLF